MLLGISPPLILILLLPPHHHHNKKTIKQLLCATWASLALSGKESTCPAGDIDLIPGTGRSPGEGNGNPLQYSCLENPMDRGAWRAAVHGVTKSQTRLNTVSYTMSKTTQIMPFNPHDNCIIRYCITSISQRGKLGHRELNLPNVTHLVIDEPAFTIKWPHSFIPEPGLLTAGSTTEYKKDIQ